MAQRVRTTLAAACLALACSSSASEVAGPAAVTSERAPEPDDPEERPEERPVRVLVTGFNDWRELGEPPNLWRCRDNPSCRLLLGDAHDAEPRSWAGPLVQRLEAAAPEVDWRFASMPVTWGAFARVPDDVDVIINIGLGVYDRFDALQLEAGAYNLRQGADAAGVERSGPIDAAAPATLAAPVASPIADRLASLAGRSVAGYTVVVAEARQDNSYLCNETHYHALSSLARGDGSLREVYFLHIPYAKDGDYAALAEGVAGVVLGLVGR
jgi:hypothetical protein